jgi:hypothetical protein
MGVAEMEQDEARYSPENPRELAKALRPVVASKFPPSLLVMRVSAARAAASARRARSMRSAVSSE